MSEIIDGKKIAKNIEGKIKKQILQKKLHPKLVVVFVGSDSPSQTYIKRKQEAALRVGIDFVLKKFPATVTKQELINQIKQIQKKEKPSGLIVQLPLPEPLWTPEVLNAVDPAIDVDCLTDTNQGKLLMNKAYLEPPTPGAVLEILKFIKINPKGKTITVLGTGRLVGKPLVAMLNNAGATVIACNSQTKNIKNKCLQTDIIVTAVGKNKILTTDMVKKGTIVIDTGIVFVNKKMKGDVDFEKVKNKASWITPVPGGVGPITVSLLLKNTLKCYEINRRHPHL